MTTPEWKLLLEHAKKVVSKKYEIKNERSTRFSYDYEGWTLELAIKEYYIVNAITVRVLAIKLLPEFDEDSILNLIRGQVNTAHFEADDMDNHIYATVQTVIENKTGYTMKVHESLSNVVCQAAQKAQLVRKIQEQINMKNHENL